MDERPDGGIGETLLSAEDGGGDVVVVESDLVVRVPGGEADVPIGGDRGRRKTEIGERERVDLEFREARAEDEPDDEGDGGGDDEGGD